MNQDAGDVLYPGACTARRVRNAVKLLDFDAQNSAAALGSPLLCDGLYDYDADDIDALIEWLSVLRDGLRSRFAPRPWPQYGVTSE
jgi:hypothetical protein